MYICVCYFKGEGRRTGPRGRENGDRATQTICCFTTMQCSDTSKKCKMQDAFPFVLYIFHIPVTSSMPQLPPAPLLLPPSPLSSPLGRFTTRRIRSAGSLFPSFLKRHKHGVVTEISRASRLSQLKHLAFYQQRRRPWLSPPLQVLYVHDIHIPCFTCCFFMPVHSHILSVFLLLCYCFCLDFFHQFEPHPSACRCAFTPVSRNSSPARSTSTSLTYCTK